MFSLMYNFLTGYLFQACVLSDVFCMFTQIIPLPVYSSGDSLDLSLSLSLGDLVYRPHGYDIVETALCIAVTSLKWHCVAASGCDGHKGVTLCYDLEQRECEILV